MGTLTKCDITLQKGGGYKANTQKDVAKFIFTLCLGNFFFYNWVNIILLYPPFPHKRLALTMLAATLRVNTTSKIMMCDEHLLHFVRTLILIST